MAFVPHLSSSRLDGLSLLVDERATARGVLVAFTDRAGGVSDAPYDSLNLAARTGDVPARVAENRRLALGALGLDADRLVLARQVHGRAVLEIPAGGSGVVGEGDVLVARRAGPVAAMLSADCAPVVLAGGGGVAVVHAGWRGLTAGVIESGVAAVEPVWAAWVGPCIGACCYRVGDEVTDAFRASGLPVAAPGRVDIAEATVAALSAAGVEAVAAAGRCTHHDARYFSYRRDGITGRQAALAALLQP